MIYDYEQRSPYCEHGEFLERAWETYRATTPRPRLFPSRVNKYHSYLDLLLDRDQRVINWFLSQLNEIVN